MNHILYHYTDFLALNGLLSDAEMRVNNVLNMNDASEMKFFMTSLCQAVCERLNRIGQNREADDIQLLFLNEFQKSFTYSVYAACFSRFPDDAAQWERYGYRGRGVCIGFDEHLLKKIANGPLSLQEVCYGTDLNSQEMTGEFFALLKGHSLKEPDIMEQVSRLMKQAWARSASYKHPSFASEQEVRMILTPYGDLYSSIRPAYHISRERIKKYYPLNMKLLCSHAGIEWKDLIVSIRIGPESVQSLPILQDYLQDNGLPWLADKIFTSDCPLRSTQKMLI